MATFKTEEIDAGVLEGTIKIGNEEITVNIDLENDDVTMGDFKELIAGVEKFADYFTADKQAGLAKDITKIILDAAVEEGGEKPTEDDYTTLQNDLELVDIYAFVGGFVLTYSAEQCFNESDIIAQLNEDYTIDEIAMYDQDGWEDEEDEEDEEKNDEK